MNKNLRKLAIIALATLFVVTTLSTALVAIFYDSVDPSAKSNVEIVVPVNNEDDKSQTTSEEEKKVLLVDASGSMSGNIFASAGYDTVQKFSDYIGQSDGDSYIYTNIVRALDMGVQVVGIVTDLESYPVSDMNALNGKKYENVSITFYLPADVRPAYVKDYSTNWSNALNQENCTLLFVYADGTKMVVFDKYSVVEEQNADDDKVNSEIVVKVDTEATLGDAISFKTLVMILGTIIDLFCIFGIILLALVANSDRGGKENDVPDDIQEALKDPVAMDGSRSIDEKYQEMVAHAEKLNVTEVWRFAEDVEKMSIEKAKNMATGSKTSGWLCLKKMFDAKISRITILTDFGFNDDSSVADGIYFDHITMIIPANLGVDENVKQRVAGMCKTCKVIQL